MPTRPGLCLQAVRVIIEHALDWNSHELYGRYLIAGTSRRLGTADQRLDAARLDPWAADLEASVKVLGWSIPAAERQPGDLVFNHNAAVPYGHVGILVDHGVVLENIAPSLRPESIHLGQSLAFTEFGSRPWTLVARLPELREVSDA